MNMGIKQDGSMSAAESWQSEITTFAFMFGNIITKASG